MSGDRYDFCQVATDPESTPFVTKQISPATNPVMVFLAVVSPSDRTRTCKEKHACSSKAPVTGHVHVICDVKRVGDYCPCVFFLADTQSTCVTVSGKPEEECNDCGGNLCQKGSENGLPVRPIKQISAASPSYGAR